MTKSLGEALCEIFNFSSACHDATATQGEDPRTSMADLIMNQLKSSGLEQVSMDTSGYVSGVLPSNSTKRIPIIGLACTVDTKIHLNGNAGLDLIQSSDLEAKCQERKNQIDAQSLKQKNIVHTPTQEPNSQKKCLIAESIAQHYKVNDLCKAGCLLTVIQALSKESTIKHGEIKVLISQKIESATGLQAWNREGFNADLWFVIEFHNSFGILNEPKYGQLWNLMCEGYGIHPGFAYGKLESALSISAQILTGFNDYVTKLSQSNNETRIEILSWEGSTETGNAKILASGQELSELDNAQKELKRIMDLVITQQKRSKAKCDVVSLYSDLPAITESDERLNSYTNLAFQAVGLKRDIIAANSGSLATHLRQKGLSAITVALPSKIYEDFLEFVDEEDLNTGIKLFFTILSCGEQMADK